MSDPADPDERTIAELRAMAARVDPVPQLVLDSAKAVLGWRRLDADLAELLSDTALDREPAGMALARGTDAPVRAVSFGAGDLVIELEIHRDGDRRNLLGQLLPAAPVRIELQALGRPRALAAESDSFGRFRIKLAAGGPVRLRIVPQGPGPEFETSWITV
jgi:hypothetical protein